MMKMKTRVRFPPAPFPALLNQALGAVIIPMKSILAVLVLAVAVSGCVGASHSRTITEYIHQPDGSTNIVNTVEYTKLHSTLSTTALKGFSEITKDGTNGYSRAVKVQDTSTDISAQIGAIAHDVAAGVAEGMAKGAKGGL